MVKQAQPLVDKGGKAEEALRRYFLASGAFVIRGVPIIESGTEITDLDLWVYSRTNPYSHQVAFVEIKNKKRAKGFERVLWARGVKQAVGADDAIVATSDNREDIVNFAHRLGVRVLAPKTLKAILERYKDADSRLSTEELFDMFKPSGKVRGGSFRETMNLSASLLSKGVGFNAINFWTEEAAKNIRNSMAGLEVSEQHVRLLYFHASLVALGADYVARGFAFEDLEARKEKFRSGLQLGDEGVAARKQILDFVEVAVTEYIDRTGAAASTIRKGIDRSVAELPVEPLAEHFAKRSSGRELFDAAIQLEAACFSRALVLPSSLPSEAKSIIALLTDYAGLSRRSLLAMAHQAPETAFALTSPG